MPVDQAILLIQKINLLTKLGKYDQAEKLVEKLVQFGFHETSFYYLGIIRYSQSRYNQAEKLLLDYLKTDANHRHGQYYLACTYRAQNRKELAYRTTKNALSNYAEDVDLNVLRGFICIETKRFEEIEECIETLNGLRPNHQGLFQLKIEYLIDKKKYTEAISMCQKALSQHPENSTFLSLIARCEYNTQQYSQSKETTFQALQINPEDPLSQSLYKRHKLAEHPVRDAILFLGFCALMAVLLVWLIVVLS